MNEGKTTGRDKFHSEFPNLLVKAGIKELTKIFNKIYNWNFLKYGKKNNALSIRRLDS